VRHLLSFKKEILFTQEPTLVDRRFYGRPVNAIWVICGDAGIIFVQRDAEKIERRSIEAKE